MTELSVCYAEEAPPMSVRTFLCITLLTLCHSLGTLHALTNEVPQETPSNAGKTAESLPDAPTALDADGKPIPVAVPLPASPRGKPVHVEAAQQQINGHTYTLIGEVTLRYRDYTVRADKVSYNQDTGDIEADGHLQIEGPGDVTIQADHGTMNVDIDSARFYQVIGSVGMRTAAARKTVVYTGINPFIFTGRVVIQEGPRKFRIIDGTMTSCALPHPDWRITAGEIHVGEGVAYAKNGAFRAFNFPILYLPYVTHPVGESDRQSGFLIPVYEDSSLKGTVIGEEVFLVINRSADLTAGLEYWSKRGWAPLGELRYRGRDQNFADLHFTALDDRLHVSGADIALNGWRDLDAHTRAVSSLEYLSSYLYRNTFATSFAASVASQVDSTAFATRNEDDGDSESLHYSRYISYQSTVAGNDILISHQPELDYNTLSRSLGSTPATWQIDASVGGLNRREPAQPGEAKFETAQEVGRIDAHPTVALPLHFDGWRFRPQVGLRETFYSSSQNPGLDIPTYRNGSANREALEAGFDLRPPVMERDFNTPWLSRLFGGQMRHVIAPELEYSYRGGIGNFPQILRFDSTDVVSNTNELKFTLAQRFYFKRAADPKGAPACTNKPVPPPVTGKVYLPLDYRECSGDTRTWISWNLTGAYFFDPQFGGAVLPFRRNVLDSTLDLSGIAFLSGPRDYSPVISRLAFHNSDRVTVGSDLDYDTKAGRLVNSNVYTTFRDGNYFGSISEDRLNALHSQSVPFLSQSPATLAALADQVSRFTPVTAYSQLQFVLGYGYGTKPGFSAGLNAGYDFEQSRLEYGGAQATYNWNCCGLTLEYRRVYVAGSAEDENVESFNFTLAGVGTAGNTNRSQLVY
jgi:LPS-assembly protein